MNSPAATAVPRLSQTINPAGTKEMRIETASDAPLVITGQTADGLATLPLAPSSKSLEPRGKDVEVDAFAPDGKTGRFIVGGSVNSELGKAAAAAKPTEAKASATVPMDAKESLDATAGAGGMGGGRGWWRRLHAQSISSSTSLRKALSSQQCRDSLYFKQLKESKEEASLPNAAADPNKPIGLQLLLSPAKPRNTAFLKRIMLA